MRAQKDLEVMQMRCKTVREKMVEKKEMPSLPYASFLRKPQSARVYDCITSYINVMGSVPEISSQAIDHRKEREGGSRLGTTTEKRKISDTESFKKKTLKKK
jgi:hypothetical protein